MKDVTALPDLIIGDLRINPPIIQGGMGVRVSGARLASAVSNEGALGVVASVGTGEEWPDRSLTYAARSYVSLRDMLQHTKALTPNPIAVNIRMRDVVDSVDGSSRRSRDRDGTRHPDAPGSPCLRRGREAYRGDERVLGRADFAEAVRGTLQAADPVPGRRRPLADLVAGGVRGHRLSSHGPAAGQPAGAGRARSRGARLPHRGRLRVHRARRCRPPGGAPLGGLPGRAARPARPGVVGAAARSRRDRKGYSETTCDGPSRMTGSTAVTALGVRVLRTPIHAPQANAFCERLPGSLRRECLDYLISFGEDHLRKILRAWRLHYNRGRPHSHLGPGLPEPDAEVPAPPLTGHRPPRDARVVARSILGGLHHEHGLEKLAA